MHTTHVSSVAVIITGTASCELNRCSGATIVGVLKIFCVSVDGKLRKYLCSTTPRWLLVTKDIENFSVTVLVL
jgi:hypothetical protein